MPVIKSAIKKAKQDEKSRKHNRGIIDAYKKSIKDLKKLSEGGDKKKLAEALKEAYSKIDIAAKKNLIHKKNAARKKSQLSRMAKGTTPKKDTPKVAKKEVKKVAPKVAKK